MLKGGIWKLGLAALVDVLPTRENLASHRVIMDGGCELCKMNSKSVIHVLWQCGVAQDIWAGSLRRLQKARTGHTDFMQLVVDLILSLPGDEQELFWVQCWIIWSQRNSLLHGGKIQNPTLLNKRARDYLDEFRGTQAQLAVSANSGSVQAWRPPTGSVYKLNFDAAVFASTRTSGVGVVIRNCLGEVMAGLSACGPAVASSEEVEALACRKAVEFAIDAGFKIL